MFSFVFIVFLLVSCGRGTNQPLPSALQDQSNPTRPSSKSIFPLHKASESAKLEKTGEELKSGITIFEAMVELLQRYHKSHNELILQDENQLTFLTDSRLQEMLIRPLLLNFGRVQPSHQTFGRPFGIPSKAAHEFRKVNYSFSKQGVDGESTATAYFWIDAVGKKNNTLRIRLHSVLVHNTKAVKINRSNRRNVSDLAVIMTIKL